MTSVLIIENQEPSDCATCPLFFRNAGVCSWTMRFDGDCPLQRAFRKAWKPKQAEEKMKDRDCETCVHAHPFGGENDNRCDAWDCEYINRKEAIEAYKERREAEGKP